MSASPFSAGFIPGSDLPDGQWVSWSGLHGSSRALALHATAQKNPGITLVVTRSSHQAQVLVRDLDLLAVRRQTVLLFPDHETLPYDPFSPHPDIISERLATLSAASGLKHGLVLVSVASLTQRLPPVSYILQRSFELHRGEAVSIEGFRQRLVHSGYESAEQVYQPGQFAIRGSVIDLYPAGRASPIRLDLFDEEIESIREFDPETQRSSGKLDRITMLPAREYPSAAVDLDDFRRAFRLRFDVDTRRVPLYQDLRAGSHPQGLEQYLPLFYADTSSFLDYFPASAEIRLVIQSGALEAATELSTRTRDRWEQRRYDIERPVLDPEELFFMPGEVEQRLRQFSGVELMEDAARVRTGVTYSTRPAPDVHIHERG